MPHPVVLVTGASRGIGAATARLFAANSYAVGINYTKASDAALELVAEIRSDGGEAIAIQADVSVAHDVESMFQTMDAQLGTLDVLVNNAGIFGPRSRVVDLPLDELEHVIATNVTGAIHCAQQAIRRMSTNHGGRGGAIINVSSGSAYLGNPGNGVHYAVSKGALNSFNIGVSQELAGEGIRVNAVSPGMTITDMTDALPLETFTSLPMGRGAEPEEIAEAIWWLSTSSASYVAGANIRVGGGKP